MDAIHSMPAISKEMGSIEFMYPGDRTYMTMSIWDLADRLQDSGISHNHHQL